MPILLHKSSGVQKPRLRAEGGLYTGIINYEALLSPEQAALVKLTFAENILLEKIINAV
jgi:hypothetical protein